MNEDLNTLAARHYENFPVGSLFIPRELRRPVHLVYAFARVADDMADEGDLGADERLRRLDRWEGSLLKALEEGEGTGFFRDLAEIVAARQLPVELFRDLVEAFRMDARSTRYASFDDLLCYCRRSANPVGRIMLRLFKCESTERDELSDDICTALQLANFWQDLSVDTKRNRFYIPDEDFARFGVDPAELAAGGKGPSVRALGKFEVERTRTLFLRGERLLKLVPRRLRFELLLIWHGGMRILEKIERMEFDTTTRRPALTRWDRGVVLVRALTGAPHG